jgi:hypothetical protein
MKLPGEGKVAETKNHLPPRGALKALSAALLAAFPPVRSAARTLNGARINAGMGQVNSTWPARNVQLGMRLSF